jgi:hypothetical protein
VSVAGRGIAMPARRSARGLPWLTGLLVAWCVMAPVRAQLPAPAAATTGDAWLDATLVDMGRYAARYPDAFVDELSRYQAAPRGLVVELVGSAHWPAGDVYFACALARIAAQPCRAVVAMRAQDPSREWSALEQRLGVAPDSAGFHQLKRGIVSSYARWARPLRVDASLHAEFPKLPLQAEPAAKVEAGPASKHSAAPRSRHPAQ